jgi:hypothetical protein
MGPTGRSRSRDKPRTKNSRRTSAHFSTSATSVLPSSLCATEPRLPGPQDDHVAHFSPGAGGPVFTRRRQELVIAGDRCGGRPRMWGRGLRECCGAGCGEVSGCSTGGREPVDALALLRTLRTVGGGGMAATSASSSRGWGVERRSEPARLSGAWERGVGCDVGGVGDGRPAALVQATQHRRLAAASARSEERLGANRAPADDWISSTASRPLRASGASRGTRSSREARAPRSRSDTALAGGRKSAPGVPGIAVHRTRILAASCRGARAALGRQDAR